MSEDLLKVICITLAVLSGFFLGHRFARINLKTPKEWYEHGQWWRRQGELTTFTNALYIFLNHRENIPKKINKAITKEMCEAMKKIKGKEEMENQ